MLLKRRNGLTASAQLSTIGDNDINLGPREASPLHSLYYVMHSPYINLSVELNSYQEKDLLPPLSMPEHIVFSEERNFAEVPL